MAQENALSQIEINNATLLAEWANGWPEHNPQRAHDRLFRAADGRYFLHHATSLDDFRGGKVAPLTAEEARAWASQFCNERTLKRLFE